MVVTMIFIIFCHVTVFRETRQHEQRLAAQQVTQEAREKFEKEKKAIKITFSILTVFVLCCVPFVAFRVVLQLTHGKDGPTGTVKVVGQLSRSALLLNSLLNPIIYSVRIKQFRVAFKKLLGGTGNVLTSDDLGVFRAPNAANSCRAGRNPDERNGTERNSNKTASDIVPQRRNFCV
ncbi:PREDICTED: neuropeptides capa receptor-like [Acropora digitifera]|uniref:neuropeptides capa receptor-like n=1 Tax=Acropora digitifera TaxID=70779 RepID=UPI00077AF976|nr:PREDICTED: neuropeptides capa receptor-like [Acropora digitifera]